MSSFMVSVHQLIGQSIFSTIIIAITNTVSLSWRDSIRIVIQVLFVFIVFILLSAFSFTVTLFGKSGNAVDKNTDRKPCEAHTVLSWNFVMPQSTAVASLGNLGTFTAIYLCVVILIHGDCISLVNYYSCELLTYVRHLVSFVSLLIFLFD